MEQQTNLLQELEQEIHLEPASVGLRFANHLIDLILYYVIVFIAAFFITIAMINSGQDLESGFLVEKTGSAILLQYVVFISLYVLMYTILEGSTKGKTLGKLITGTRATKTDGSPITWKDALIRSICRLVPFEAFSALGGFPWHDKWTDTTVTKERKF